MIVFTSHAADPGDLFEFYVGDIKHILIVKRASMIIILLLFNLLIEPLLFDFFPFWQASVFKLSKLNFWIMEKEKDNRRTKRIQEMQMDRFHT